MATTRIEYAAYYPFNTDPDTEWLYYGPTKRDEAEKFVAFVNSRMIQAGSEYRAELQERKVLVGKWEPSNTGIVPPHITERIKNE